MSKYQRLRLIEGEQGTVERYRRNPQDTARNPRAPHAARTRLAAEIKKSIRAGKAVRFKVARRYEYVELITIGWEHQRELCLESGTPLSLQRNCPPADLQRWAVNYLRHQETNYDAILLESFDPASAAYNFEIKRSVLRAIGKAYPELRDECSRQLAYSRHEGIAA